MATTKIYDAGGDLTPVILQNRSQHKGITAAHVQLCQPNATTFFNSRVTASVHRELDVLTQIEIESLSSKHGSRAVQDECLAARITG